MTTIIQTDEGLKQVDSSTQNVDAYEDLGARIGKGFRSSFMGMLTMAQVAQDGTTALSQLINKEAEEEVLISQQELVALGPDGNGVQKRINDITKNYPQGDSDQDKKDRVTADQNLAALQNEYTRTQQKYQTQLQECQTNLQGLTQKQQSALESTRVFFDGAADISQLWKDIAGFLRGA